MVARVPPPLPAQNSRCMCSVTRAYLLKARAIERGQTTLSSDNHKANKQVFRETMASSRFCRAGCQFGDYPGPLLFTTTTTVAATNTVCGAARGCRHCPGFFLCRLPFLPLYSPVWELADRSRDPRVPQSRLAPRLCHRLTVRL